MADNAERNASGESSRDLDELFSLSLKSEKSVWQLRYKACNLYLQASYNEAAALFHQAAELAERQGNTEERCGELHWEGVCYGSNDQLLKALTCFLLAEELQGLNPREHCANLTYLFEVSEQIPLPFPQLSILLDRIKPYQTVWQIGGSKSMALIHESHLLNDCGQYAEALARAQEAFMSQVEEEPWFNDSSYFQRLTDAYRVNGRLDDAWDILRRWRAEGSLEHVITKSRQWREEAKLLYAEGKVSDAWDALLLCYREERIIGRAGLEIDTLVWLIQVGAERGRFRDICPYLKKILRFRNSESMFNRFYCREAFARYFLALCASGTLSTAELVQTRRHIAFWLEGRGECPGARTLARELDKLLSAKGVPCVKWTSRVEAMEAQYRVRRIR